MTDQPHPTDIVLLTEIYPPAIGGTATLWQNVYGRLQRHSVAVVTDATTSPGADSRSERLQVYRKAFHTRHWGVLSPRALQDHLRTIRALRSVPAHSGTLVHCARAIPEGVSAMLSALGRRRYLCWAHGEEITTGAASREFAGLIRTALSRAGAVFANSANTRALVENLGIRREQIAVVYPGVDLQRFNPGVSAQTLRARYAPHGEVLLVSVARLQRRKGHDHAIAALARIQTDCPDARLIVVGDGEERGRLEQMAADFRLGDRVVFTGPVSEGELPQYHALADVFVHPNRIHEGDTEGFGIVFLEAQASGRPVVGGRSGGVPETMIEGETGMLVSGEDVDETAAVFRRLIQDADLRARMGAAGRSFVARTFSWDAAARAVGEVHDAVVRFGSLQAARAD